MKRYLLGMLLFLAAGMLQAAGPRDPETHFFDQTLGDFREEMALAKAEGKTGVLLFFELQDCPFCERMKRTVLNQPEVQDFYKQHFLIFPVDIEGQVDVVDFQGHEMTEKDFAFKENRVRATPVFLFVDLEGKPVARYTGATRDKEEFMLLGRYVVDGIYKSQSFTRYKRQQRAAVSH